MNTNQSKKNKNFIRLFHTRTIIGGSTRCAGCALAHPNVNNVNKKIE
jgi:hypothetical protein